MLAALERLGTSVGGTDMLTATHAQAEDSALVTNNAIGSRLECRVD